MKESSKKKKRPLEKDAKEKSRSKKDKKERKHGKRLREGEDREFVAQRPFAGTLAQSWVAMSRASASAEVPLFASAEEAFHSLPARYASFSEASLPVDRAERHAALSALAEIATGFSPAELGFFARSLELALVERRKGQEVTAGPTRPTRARPLFPDAPMPTPPSARPPAPPPPPSTIGASPAPPKPPAPPPPPVAIRAVPPKPPTVPEPSPSAAPCGAPAEASQSQSKELAKYSTSGPLPPEPEPKVLVPDPESESSSTSEDENSKPEARALQKKADAEAADKVYELCRALAEKPCQVDGKLQAANIRQFVRDLLAVASQPLHWEEAWSRMGMPESLRSEAGIAFLSNLLEFASGPVGTDLDDAARVSAGAIAALSKGHRLKMSQVEDFLIKRLDSDSKDPQLWKVLSWLLFHWFPQGKTAGWGWWRVGWSWSQWWKVVDRLLCRAAETGHGEEAFGMLRASLCRMQVQPRCKKMFLKPPFDDERRQQLMSRLAALLPDTLPEDVLKKKLEPLRL
ncbi:unnamed protein product [Symbiodinium sp. CCMP2592]|nr:unnamed protein product [Symbiodinium sp. CCMP2592]